MSSIKTNSDNKARVLRLTRSEVLTLTYVAIVLSGLFPVVMKSIQDLGYLHAISSTFSISAIVWISLGVAMNFALQDAEQKITILDGAVCLVVFLLCFLPITSMAWFLLTVFSLYVMVTSFKSVGRNAYRAAWILLALTVPMFWSKIVFNLFSNYFLQIDAIFVSSITASERIGNLVAMPGGDGYLQISAPCSSVANISLTVLCWTLFTQIKGLRWAPINMLWCAFAGLSVLAVNVTRISLIGFFPERYELLHGPVGSTFTSWIVALVVMCICYQGAGFGRVKRV